MTSSSEESGSRTEAAASSSEDAIGRVRGLDVDGDAESRTPLRRRKSDQSPPEDDISSNSATTTATTTTTTTTATTTVADASSEASSLPPLTEEEYDPARIVRDVQRAAAFNQGWLPGQPYNNLPGKRRRDEREWDHDFVRRTVDDYERHLHYVLARLPSAKGGPRGAADPSSSARRDAGEDAFAAVHPDPARSRATHRLLAPAALADAAKALTRCRMDTPALARRVRGVERLVGLIGWTPITEELSYRLLEANGKAGNARRTLALLELRRRSGYAPRERENSWGGGLNPGEKEFVHAITSISAAQVSLRRCRNIYLHESAMPPSALENPTNYLDAILINMSRRGVPLTPAMAARMLACYASTGRTGRAVHYFYKMMRDPIEEDGYYIPGPHPMALGKEGLEAWKEARRKEGAGSYVASRFEEDDSRGDDDHDDEGASIELEGDARPPLRTMTKMRMAMHMQSPPPFHKIPSVVRGQNISDPSSFRDTVEDRSSPSALQTKGEMKTKYDWEIDPKYSLSLTAAFAFADSLAHGACGHDPVELDVVGWNCLIKACCHRGALHRAIRILDETMPQKGIEPDTYSYNTLLAGLARVGDVVNLREYLTHMTNRGVTVDKYTVQAVADGLLNVGDIPGASSVVQDVFNQHNALPPYTTHLKILEFALANGLIFEAKRHVYFIQQLWKWTPSPHHSEEFRRVMESTKHNPKLSRRALQKLFRYYHEELHDKDFF